MSLIDQGTGDRGTGGASRQPRFKVKINAAAVDGFHEFEVTSNSHFTADTFRATAALSRLPAALDAAYWSNTGDQTIEILADDTGAGSFTSLILGQVDDVELDLAGRALTLSGRDLSARFIDTKTTERFQNLTSSAIAALLAARHGLQASIRNTSTPVGRYYEIEHARMTSEQSEWDLLTYLAQEEGFDLWVAGQTLHFQPPPPLTATPYPLRWREPAAAGPPAANFTRMRMSRSLTLARDVIVRVASWNQNQEKTFVTTFRISQAHGGQKGHVRPQLYSFTIPNLTPDQALKWAKQKAEEITRHERLLTVELPADHLLSTRSVVRLAGTGTSWDQTYRVASVERRMAFEDGYRMSVRLKNHSPQNTVVL